MTEVPYCLVHAHTTWKKDYKASALLPRHSVENNPSYLNMVPNLKLLNRKRRKGCLCKLSTKSQSQTHLHLPDCQSALNFSKLRVPVPGPSQKPYVISPRHAMCKRLINDSGQCLSGHLGVTGAHTLVGGGPMIWLYEWSFLAMESHGSSKKQYTIQAV